VHHIGYWVDNLPPEANRPAPDHIMPGSARGYQELTAPLAIPATAGQQAARPYIYASPALGVNARIWL